MIGYGFLNSEIQNFAMSGIIYSFLQRNLFFTYPIYMFNYYSTEYQVDRKIPSEFVDVLYSEFIKEESLIYSLEKNESLIIKEQNLSQKITLKYYLSSNVAKYKDYDFIGKDNEKILEDGKNNLKQIFEETLNKFNNLEIINEIASLYEKYIAQIYAEGVIAKKDDKFASTISGNLNTVGSRRELFANVSKNLSKELYNNLLNYSFDQRKNFIFQEYNLDFIVQKYNFYKQNNLLDSRNIYLNILNEQINSLNQGDKI